MSATRDYGSKVRFLYTNMHSLYKKGVSEAKAAVVPETDPAIVSLKQNLESLNNLHDRLRFMIQELEEIVKP